FTFRFMTYPERNFEAFDPAVDVPMRQRPDLKGQDLLYILGDVYLPLVSVLRGFYPHGVYREVRHPYNGVLLYWTYWVSAAEAARASTVSTGLTGDYYQDGLPADPDHPEKSPHWVEKTKAFERVDPEILFQWTVTPLPGDFSVLWHGSLEAPRTGTYDFAVTCDSWGQLVIDGQTVVTKPMVPGDDFASRKGRIFLTAGRHSLRLKCFVVSHNPLMELWWKAPKGVLEVVPSADLSKR
ncbi:MAG TPA: PA14 domain-containing protein, partial [bacterium]|nr:PA14 domain-containing protein [bacterium]